MSGDTSTMVTIVGAAFAAYLAVRVGLASLQATVSTALSEISRRLDRMELSRDKHSENLSDVRERQANHEARLASLEQHRPQTGSFQAVSADQTGPHGR